MGQKCNPTGLRIGVIKNWDSRWYAKKGDFADLLVEDYNLRKYLLKTLHSAGVPKVEIERDAKRVRINIHCAKPGMVIGKQGAEIEKLKEICAKKLGKDTSEVFINIVEIKSPDLNATLVAQSIAQQLERRVAFRRAVKGAIRNTMRLGARGIKIQVSGRIGGAEIARSETYKEGTIPLQTIRADIDYGTWEAATTYGRIGIKVWIYQGEVLRESRNNNRRRSDNRRRNNNRKEGGNK
ncbi:MAG: 30S ribosomal protein S3 [Eubacterium sp.]|nr:30S ribosomal protein S3 [Eubacterium sp.]MBR1532005.1 30S ribosomal protein S3 [Eubacterium sp.]